MLPQEIIRKKRDGQKLSVDEIKEFVTGVTNKSVTESQVAAFCMAVFFKEMAMDERVSLTVAMAQSGTVIDWLKENLSGPVLDKHSTGGIGDKVSLILAPIVAACGGFVPMLSGRGLGHTGGTLDKMDSIPGYQSQPDIALFKKVVREAGCAIIGATPEMAPADKIFYAVRGVTATVESLDLITASVLSKKLAAGLQGLVMDMKFGSGAFMRRYDDAKVLAESIVSVADSVGLPTVGLLTDMNQVLGRTAGNALEVKEAIEYLKNQNVDSRLHEVTVALTAELLVLGKLAQDTEEARQKIETVLKNGKAAEHFARMVTALRGAADLMDKPEKYLKAAPLVKDFYPAQKDKISAMDLRAIGIGIIEIGGGRARSDDTVDYSVGLSNVAQIGEEIGKGARPLATIHVKDEADFLRISRVLTKATLVAGEVGMSGELIKTRITA